MVRSKRKQSEKGVVRVNTSFACLPDLLEEAKEFCYQERVSFSSKMEELVREWVEKENQKKK
jgi:hypothetical protein